MATTKKPTSAATRIPKKTASAATSKPVAAKSTTAKSTTTKSASPKPAARKTFGKPVEWTPTKRAATTDVKPAARSAAKKPAAKKPVTQGEANRAAAKKAAARPAAARPAAKGAKARPADVAAAPKQRKTAKAGNVPTDIVERLRGEVKRALEELKAKDVVEIDVRGRTSIADYIVVASGTSTRHVKSVADEVVKYAKKTGVMPLGVEGQREAEWVLVDLGDIVVHVMLPRVREFYGLERLWTVGGEDEREAAFG